MNHPARNLTKTSARKNFVVAALLAAVVYFAAPTPGCGPFLPDAIFTYAAHPDFPLVNFARGDLGVLQPSYARSYLVIAYRNLAGTPLTAKEQQAALNIWKTRLTSNWYPGQPYDHEKTAAQEWLDERAKVPGVAKVDQRRFGSFGNDPLGISRMASEPYQFFYNCLPSAFSFASSTLQQRIEKFGADSPDVKSWLVAQDQVFANCPSHPDTNEVFVPAAAHPDNNSLIRSDRAYQIAAAYFYAEDFPKAEALFTEIANDKSSPWANTARLLVARSYIRETTLGAEENGHGFRYAPMAKAETQLKAILVDKNLAEIHPAARRLLGFVEFRLHPRGRLLELSDALSRKDGSANFEQDLIDYTLLLDEWGNLASDPTEAPAPKESITDREELLQTLRTQSEVTDWVLTMQTPDAASADHALERWQTLHSIPWLVATLATISPQHPQAAAIAAAAANTSPDSSAFATITFHRARILMNSGKQDAARDELDRVLAANRENFPPSSLNLIVAERFRLARDFDEFLKYAPREAAGIVTFNDLEIPDGDNFENAFSMNEAEYKPAPQIPLFDSDSVRIINRQLPLAMLRQAASSTMLPEDLRAQIAQVAWVRAVLLEDDAAAKSFAPVVARLTPALKSDIDKFSAEKTAEDRRFAAILEILRNPGLRPNATAGALRKQPLDKIDQYRDNWWCAAEEPKTPAPGEKIEEDQTVVENNAWFPTLTTPLENIWLPNGVAAPPFLTDNDSKTASAEWKRLAAVGPAPDSLTSAVLAWAKAHPDDERVPEALHLAVRSTRFGCTNPSTAKLSKQAFELLHTKYPKSSWAAKTPYWYTF